MFLLYSLQIVMLLIATSLVAVPFIVKKEILATSLLSATAFLALFSLALYQLTTDKIALNDWLTRGKTHYQLAEQFNALGGIDGIIARVQAKLKENPSDAKGWMILGKLYLAKHDDAAASAAFQKAKLSP